MTAPPATVREIAVPPEARGASTLRRIGYAEAFLVDVGRPADLPAEEWARLILDDAPPALRWSLWLSWLGLGLRLAAPRSPRFVLGWEVRRTTPDVALLGARSRIGMPAELLVMRRDESLLFGTFVQRENALARAVWAATLRVHRPAVRSVLAQASRRARGRGGRR